VLVCENCGANNEPKLTFCRTCGARLPKVKQAPPSDQPETLRGANKVEAEAAPIVTAPIIIDKKPAVIERVEKKPSTPPPSDPAPVAAKKAEEERAPEPAARPEDDQLKCEQCGVQSPKDYRFCVGCGAVLPRKREGGAGLAISAARGRVGSARPAASEPPPAAQPKPERRPEIKLEPRVEPKPEPQPEIKVEPKPEIKVEPKPEPKPAIKVVPKPEPRGEPESPVRATVPDGSAVHREPVRVVEEVTGRLVVIVEDGSEGTTLELQGRQLDIGSAEGDIILEEDRYLSPRHARLFRQDGHWYLRDLDSVNGVFRRLRKPATLRNRDTILLGLEVLRFETLENAERGLGQAVQSGVLMFGSPATPRRARLVQRTVEGVTRDVFHLVNDETALGREVGDIVFTTDPFMSRRHAMVTWNESSREFVLSDLSSSNGTYLAIRNDVRLEHGDFIRLGQHLFRVDLSPSQGASEI